MFVPYRTSYWLHELLFVGKNQGPGSTAKEEIYSHAQTFVTLGIIRNSHSHCHWLCAQVGRATGNRVSTVPVSRSALRCCFITQVSLRLECAACQVCAQEESKTSPGDSFSSYFLSSESSSSKFSSSDSSVTITSTPVPSSEQNYYLQG